MDLPKILILSVYNSYHIITKVNTSYLFISPCKTIDCGFILFSLINSHISVQRTIVERTLTLRGGQYIGIWSL